MVAVRALEQIRLELAAAERRRTSQHQHLSQKTQIMRSSSALVVLAEHRQAVTQTLVLRQLLMVLCQLVAVQAVVKMRAEVLVAMVRQVAGRQRKRR